MHTWHNIIESQYTTLLPTKLNILAMSNIQAIPIWDQWSRLGYLRVSGTISWFLFWPRGSGGVVTSSGGVPIEVVSPKGISRSEGSDSVDCGVSTWLFTFRSHKRSICLFHNNQSFQLSMFEPWPTVLHRILIPELIDHAEPSVELGLLGLEKNNLDRLNPV